MTKEQLERDYLENKYADFWKNQTHVYGIGNWEQMIIDEIGSVNPTKVFEVGIGTGWPIATTLQDKGVEIFGCDIADKSVHEACDRLHREYGTQIYTGDLLELDIDDKYDATYCVRSSWYMNTDHLLAVLGKMSEMTGDGGIIVIDFMDESLHRQFISKQAIEYIKTVPQRVYNILIKHKRKFFFKEYYHNREKLEAFLQNRGFDIVLSVREKDLATTASGYKTAKALIVARKEAK